MLFAIAVSIPEIGGKFEYLGVERQGRKGIYPLLRKVCECFMHSYMVN